MSENRASKDFQHHHKGKTSEARLDKPAILKVLNIIPGIVVLDAGCGNGYMAKEFAGLVKPRGKVYALDIDSEVIDRLEAENNDIFLVPMHADITRATGLAQGSIDLIYLSTVFHGFSQEQIKGFVKEVSGLLKPKGILAILEMKKIQTEFGPPLSIRLSPEELKLLIPFAGKRTFSLNDDFYLQLFEK